MITNPNRNQASLADSPVVLVLLLIVVAGVGLYLVVTRMHIRPQQLVEATLYLFIAGAAVAIPVIRRFAPDAKRLKRAPFVMPPAKDERTPPVLATGVAKGDALGLTVEPAGGSAQPTTKPILALPLPV